MVDTAYGQTFVRISGPDGAQPLVLLPGAATPSLMWTSNIKPWSEYFRTYAVDNIYDYGRSVYTRSLRNRDDFTDWLDGLFGVLNLGDRINLIGMSYGGWLAAEYTLRFQERLAKVVLIAPARTVVPIRWGFLIRAILMHAMPQQYFTRSFMYWVFRNLVMSDERNRHALEGMIESTLLGKRCFKRHGFVQPRVFRDKELQGIHVPLLFMVGEQETIFPGPAAVERLRRVAPHIETEIIPEADHGVTLEQAEMVNKVVLDFLRRRP
jgi:pimeloyl-ACP methyl ester carboxylesterase